jgi:hypothetical protein
MAYPALHRQAEKADEFSTDVESAGQATGVMVSAGQNELAGQGKADPFWQYEPALQV